MQVVTKRGRFEVIDEERSAGAPTVVLVHGFPYAAESWKTDAEALAPAMRIIAPSMRGFGGSARAELVEDRGDILRHTATRPARTATSR